MRDNDAWYHQSQRLRGFGRERFGCRCHLPLRLVAAASFRLRKEAAPLCEAVADLISALPVTGHQSLLLQDLEMYANRANSVEDFYSAEGGKQLRGHHERGRSPIASLVHLVVFENSKNVLPPSLMVIQ